MLGLGLNICLYYVAMVYNLNMDRAAYGNEEEEETDKWEFKKTGMEGRGGGIGEIKRFREREWLQKGQNNKSKAITN